MGKSGEMHDFEASCPNCNTFSLKNSLRIGQSTITSFSVTKMRLGDKNSSNETFVERIFCPVAGARVEQKLNKIDENWDC